MKNGRLTTMIGISLMGAAAMLMPACGSEAHEGDGGHDADGTDSHGHADGGPDGADAGQAPDGSADAGIAVDAGSLTLGAACSTTDECPPGGSGAPSCESSWPAGYCLVRDCSTHGHDCPGDDQPGGGKCVEDNGPVCLKLCGNASDCRQGYACGTRVDTADAKEVGVCIPE